MRTGERGAAAVLVLSLAAVLALLGAVAAALGAVAVARHRAASAADLAALAAADRALDGVGPACAAAARASRAVSATLDSCRIVGDVAEVVVSVRPPGRLGDLGVARARARAGPAEGEPDGRATSPQSGRPPPPPLQPRHGAPISKEPTGSAVRLRDNSDMPHKGINIRDAA